MCQPSRILIIRTGALGDTIVMSVVYRALRKYFPTARIEALGHAERLRLINTPGLIDRITSIDAAGFSALFLDKARFSDQQCAYFQQFDVILLYTVDPKKTIHTNLCKIRAHPVYSFDPFPPPDRNIHITAYLLDTLRVVGIQDMGLIPEILFPKTSFPTSSFDDFRVAVHPGSGSSKKNWPGENFVQICQRLINRHQARIMLICGPADRFVEDAVFPRLPADATVLIRQPDVGKLAARLRQCRLYLGNDSGISHLAAAAGVPTVALFGPSNSHVWRPIGERVEVIQGDGRPYCQGISIDAVWQVLEEMLEAQPQNYDSYVS